MCRRRCRDRQGASVCGGFFFFFFVWLFFFKKKTDDYHIANHFCPHSKIKPCSARKVAVYGAPERFEIQMPAGLIADERYSAEAVVAVADATGRAIPTLSAGDITLEIVAEGSTDRYVSVIFFYTDDTG
jgi:hypothetical protein